MTVNVQMVDARGKRCPAPLMMTRQALAAMSVGDRVTVLVDDGVAKENVCRFLQDNGAPASCQEESGVYRIEATKEKEIASSAQSAMIGEGGRKWVLSLSHSTMGSGAEELGRLLIEAAVNTLEQVPPLPTHIVCYNSGVQLACDGSAVAGTLQGLEARGVRVLVCGTCLNYYNIKNQLKAGTVSNMFDILGILVNAGHVVAL